VTVVKKLSVETLVTAVEPTGQLERGVDGEASAVKI
jgi:hypothetical protein